jgi:DNA-binding NarL/FixJ family response regulator
MPRASGFEALRQLGASGDGPSVLILTVAIEDAQLEEALELGARGIILKAATSRRPPEPTRTPGHRGRRVR